MAEVKRYSPIVIAAPSTKAKIAVVIYSLCISLMLGTSALFHIHNWTPRVRRVMRNMDHARTSPGMLIRTCHAKAPPAT